MFAILGLFGLALSAIMWTGDEFGEADTAEQNKADAEAAQDDSESAKA